MVFLNLCYSMLKLNSGTALMFAVVTMLMLIIFGRDTQLVFKSMTKIVLSFLIFQILLTRIL